MANCAQMPASLLEALASTIMEDSNGDTYFNVICYHTICSDFSSAIPCGGSVTDPEAFIVANGFGVDDCGNPAIKLRVCVEADGEREVQ
jgi:hypothetical protein